MSLRARLVSLFLVAMALALLVSDVAAYTALQSFLVGQAESRRDELGVQIASSLVKTAVDPASQALELQKFVTFVNEQPQDAYILVKDATGAIVVERMASDATSDLRAPVLPAALAYLDASANAPIPATGGRTIVPAASGGFEYAVLAVRDPSGETIVIAVSMKSTADTLGRLILIELLVSLLVLLALGAASLFLVQIGLRPLTGMEKAAESIAEGRLSARVSPGDGRTEVGRLGRALNAMLERLESAFREREESEARLRAFVADASHELRTPLAAVRGYAELYRRGADERPADRARAIRGIEDAAERMGRLVDDLLLLARLDERGPTKLQAVDLTRVVEASVESAQAANSGHEIALDCAPGIWVAGDDFQLRQAADNLLANVRVHTPRGTRATVRVAAEGPDAVLVVSDDGPGMTAEQASRAFDRFYRVDLSRARDGGGAGLGLSIVEAIVKAHSGSVTIDATPGKGTAVRVALPLIDH